MKILILTTLLCIPLIAIGQPGSLTDPRDGKTYPTTIIKGTLWMTENLDLETNQSIGLDPSLKEQYGLSGRYYHFEELSSICPVGWQLPEPDHWLRYFEYLAGEESEYLPVEFVTDKDNFIISRFRNPIDVYREGNPLQLKPTGWWEGAEFEWFKNLATYWTVDPPTYETIDEWDYSGDHVHIMAKVYKGKSHIHIRNDRLTNVHSHDHHLDPKKEKKLRRFMVRCVKTVRIE